MRRGGSRNPFDRLFKKSFSSSSKLTSTHPYGAEWPELSKKYKKEAQYRCESTKVGIKGCRNRYPPPFDWLLECHHLIPFRKSKNNKRTNIAVLCRECHNACHSHLKDRKGITDKQKRAAQRWS